MNVNLKCKKRDHRGNYSELPKWNLYNIHSKNLGKRNYGLLREAYNYRETQTSRFERILYECGCNDKIKIEMSIVKRDGKLYFSDLDAGLHDRSCPFFTYKQHRDEQGRSISIPLKMFYGPVDTENNKDKGYIDQVHTGQNITIERVKTRSETAFSGLMYSFFDSVNISSDYYGNYSKKFICNQMIGRFLNSPVDTEDLKTFSEYRDSLEKHQYISFDVGFLYEPEILLGKKVWDKKNEKFISLVQNNEPVYHIINSEFIENIKDKRYYLANSLSVYMNGSLDIMEKEPIVKYLVMKETLQGIRNYNNFTKGPYFFLKIDSKLLKKEKYTKVVKFFIQPIYVSEKFILPIESDFERTCIHYLDENHDNIQLYKPMTLDKQLYLQNLKRFLNNYPDYFAIYKQAAEIYSPNKVIRPDLFMLKENKLYIFEFAGYDSEEYLFRLEQKEKDFYCSFDSIKNIEYIKISKDTFTQDFHYYGL